jgi:UDP-glucose:(heptosyl)LPS alpha-1,3-glucosyltransferase
VKIAFVVHDYHRWGGHSRYVAELATRFSQDHEVHVFANQVERAGEQRVIFHTVPALRTNVVTTILSFAVTSKFLVRGGFDIVHSQGFCGPRSNVITAHICNEAWSRALSRFAPQTARERIFHGMASRLEKGLYGDPHCGHVIAISNRVARDVAECYGCRAPIHLIYHGVDLETFSPAVRRFRAERRQALGLTDAETAFLYVGDLRKGARQSIRALSRMPNGHLILLSRSAPEPYQALARETGVAHRVHCLPPTNRVDQFYGAADGLLLPSPYDAFAMVVTEAMACGLPVVVSREAGASELIDHGKNGLLLNDAADDLELAEHMSALQNEPDLAARLGKAARLTAEGLSWDTVAAETMRVYEEVAARRLGKIADARQLNVV